MYSSGMPQQILYGELVRGTRKKGRRKKQDKECIKETLKQSSLPPRDLETSAQDRPGWHATIKSASSKFEDKRRDKISDARARQKASATTPDQVTFQCPHCPRLYVSRIGLYSHARTHQMNSKETTSSNTMVYRWPFLKPVPILVDRSSMKRNLCLTLLQMTSVGNWTKGLCSQFDICEQFGHWWGIYCFS